MGQFAETTLVTHGLQVVMLIVSSHAFYLTHSSTTVLDSLLFLKNAKHTPNSGTLFLLFSPPGTLAPRHLPICSHTRNCPYSVLCHKVFSKQLRQNIKCYPSPVFTLNHVVMSTFSRDLTLSNILYLLTCLFASLP